MLDPKPCPKCKEQMISNGVAHSIPAYTGPAKPVSDNQLTMVVLYVCPECRYTEMYSPRVTQ